VCKHKDADQINLDCQAGVGTQQISQDYGLDRASIDHHRRSGHAERAVTAALLRASAGEELSQFAQIAIASKVNRVRVLDDLLNRTMEEIHHKKIGELNPKLMDSARSLLESAAKEMGEWRPDGGEKAEATAKLAQSIVIHGAAVAGVLGFDSCESHKLEDSSKNDAQVIDIAPDGATDNSGG
jgi:uncharacterized protein YunC (DUF1805 family)